MKMKTKSIFSLLTVCVLSLSISFSSFAEDTKKEKAKTEQCCKKSDTACTKEKAKACSKGEGCCSASSDAKGQEDKGKKKKNKK